MNNDEVASGLIKWIFFAMSQSFEEWFPDWKQLLLFELSNCATRYHNSDYKPGLKKNITSLRKQIRHLGFDPDRPSFDSKNPILQNLELELQKTNIALATHPRKKSSRNFNYELLRGLIKAKHDHESLKKVYEFVVKIALPRFEKFFNSLDLYRKDEFSFLSMVTTDGDDRSTLRNHCDSLVKAIFKNMLGHISCSKKRKKVETRIKQRLQKLPPPLLKGKPDYPIIFRNTDTVWAFNHFD